MSQVTEASRQINKRLRARQTKKLKRVKSAATFARHLRRGLRPLPLLLGSMLLCAFAEAHLDKNIDRNGGHFDNGGNYHCHDPGCRPHAPRHSLGFGSSRLVNKDEDLYYLEEDWPYWQTLAGCKTARTVVLENTSRVPVTWTNPRQCEIREGLWVDEYTGKEYQRAAQLEVDHIVPPVYANASNGWQWDYGKRVQFANDPFNLIPVARETHRKKRQRGIGSWQPRDEFQCEYAQNWKDVAEKYDLDLFGRDRGRINNILESCGDAGDRSVDEQD